MDSGNMTETLGETTQPEPVVVTDSEATEATPQAEATEEAELYVEVEGDQQDETPNRMSREQERAAWKQEREKRKKKAELAKAEKERADRLEAKVKELESKIGNVTRGPKPDPYEYASKEEFYQAYEEWENTGQPKSKADPVAQSASEKPKSLLSEDQEWHLHSSEQNLKRALPDYEDAKNDVEQELKRAFGVPNDYPIMDQIAQLSHTFDVDPAKAVYALKKMPSKIDDLVKHGKNTAQLGRILRDLESKVKVRERKQIDSTPEPNIKSGGPVDNVNANITKLREKWEETRSASDYAAYSKAKRVART
jgi:hypothetical protein